MASEPDPSKDLNSNGDKSPNNRNSDSGWTLKVTIPPQLKFFGWVAVSLIVVVVLVSFGVEINFSLKPTN